MYIGKTLFSQLMAEVAVPRDLFQGILRRIDELRRPSLAAR